MENPYIILGVDENSSFEEIKRAYMNRVRVVHPDRFEQGSAGWHSANEMLKELNIAYSMLKQLQRRGIEQNQPAEPATTSSEPDDNGEFFDIFFQ